MTNDQVILHVDDDATMRHLARNLLKNAGFTEILGAEDNASALAAIRKSRPSLIISDLNRPGGSGEELVAEVFGEPNNLEIPIVIVTGNCDFERELNLWRMGIRRFIPKPFRPAELSTAVDALLRRRRDPNIGLIEAGVEGRDLEYKERIDLATNVGRALLAREALAMANSGGGVVVVGVAERSPGEFSPVGIEESDVHQFETTRVNDAIRRYVGPTIEIAVTIIRREGRPFALLRVRPLDDTLALALAGNENAGLHPGRIYIRTSDARSAELTDPTELRRLVDRLVEARLRRLFHPGGDAAQQRVAADGPGGYAPGDRS